MSTATSQSNHASLCACGHSRGWHSNACGVDGCECAAFEPACPETTQETGGPRRFVARWIVASDIDGDHIESHSVHPTYEAAHAASLAGAKKADVCEWVCVKEEEYDRHTGLWRLLTRWTGDYEQMEESP